jgi:hypothetical protein
MLIEEKTFKRYSNGSFLAADGTYLCSEGLNRLFEIPFRTKNIIVGLHTRPSKHRWPVDVKSNGYYPFLILPGERHYQAQQIDRAIQPFADRTVYVQVDLVEDAQ